MTLFVSEEVTIADGKMSLPVKTIVIDQKGTLL
jgi:hypothetical protein